MGPITLVSNCISAMAKQNKLIFYKNTLILLLISSLFLRLILSYLFSSFPNILFGIGSNDARGFAIYAINLSNNFNLSAIIEIYKFNLYPVILAFFFKIFPASYFTANLFSVFIWIHSFFIIKKLLNNFGFSKKSIFYGLFYFCLSPSILIYSSLSVRDFLIFYCFLNSFFLILIFLKTKKLLPFISAIFFLVIIYNLHHYFLILFIFFFLILYIYFFVVTYLINLVNIHLNFISILTLLILFSISFLDLSFFYYHINTFQVGSLASPTIGRTNYIENINLIYSLLEFFNYLSKNFFSYILEPTFINFDKVLYPDLIIIIEKLFKVTIMIYFLIYIVKRKKFINNDLFLIFIIVLSIDLSFSIGTFNWGTAFRHQVITFGFIPFFIAYFYDSIVHYE